MNSHQFFKKLSAENRYMNIESIREFYYGILQVIIKEVSENGSCSCPDLGLFKVVKHKATRHRDVNTHELVYKEAIKLVKFKPCNKLKNFIKNKV